MSKKLKPGYLLNCEAGESITTAKPPKVRSFKSDTIPHKQMIMRMVAVREDTVDESAKSVQVVIASENPVERYDDQRDDVISEILLMDGVEFRTDRRQLPIVDSHDRSTVRNVLGSIRNVRTEGTELIGDAIFARDTDSQTAFQKLRDGHLTDFSITATPRNVQTIQRGETGMFRDVEIHGPVDLVTHWTPTDASLVAAGADETSTVRSELLRAYQNPQKRIKRMTDSQRTALIGRGMPEDVVTTESALEWMIQNMGDAPEELEIENEDDTEVEEIENADDEETPAEPPAEEIKNADGEEDKPKEEITSAIDRALKSDKARRLEIVALCKKAGIKRAFADKLCNDNVSLNVAREKVLERMVNQPLGTSTGSDRISVTSNSADKFEAAVRDGLIQRAVGATGTHRDPFSGGKPAPGSEDFAQMGMLRLAEEILRRGQINTSRMTPKDIAMVAMGHRPTINRLQIQRAGEAYHTTGMFPNLLLDASNKTLLAGYEEETSSWKIWARTAPSVPDFKAINRIRYSESPDLEVVPENKDYAETVTSDSRESYKVEKFGKIFSVSWETVVNDDLDAISRVPQMHGAAARRTQNKQVYAVLTANAAMSDGTALFASGHSNLAGSAAAISVTSLNAAYTEMRTQTGLSGEIINVTPSFLIVPAAIEATAYQLINSIADPSVGGSAAGNSNTHNIYGPSGQRRLTVVAEPQLDGNSTTAWYLASSNTMLDTVELAFLQGEESPILENEWDFSKDVYRYKIRQTFGVKAIDWRGLYKNAGS